MKTITTALPIPFSHKKNSAWLASVRLSAVRRVKGRPLFFLYPIIVTCLFAIDTTAQTVNNKQFTCGDCKSLSIHDIHQANKQEVYCFLSGIKKCYNSAEFMEYANPMLFALLDNDSKLVVDMLTNYPELNNKNIYDELEHPLHDPNIKRLMFIIDKSNESSTVKQGILNALSKIKNE